MADKPDDKHEYPDNEPRGDLGPVTRGLEEHYRLLLEAKETRLKLAKQEVVARIDKAFELQKQQAVMRALQDSPEVQAAENTLNVATNDVLDAVEENIPDDYAVQTMSWEQGTYTAVFAPNQKGKRNKVM